jgi:hypothetical protein
MSHNKNVENNKKALPNGSVMVENNGKDIPFVGVPAMTENEEEDDPSSLIEDKVEDFIKFMNGTDDMTDKQLTQLGNIIKNKIEEGKFIIEDHSLDEQKTSDRVQKFFNVTDMIRDTPKNFIVIPKDGKDGYAGFPSGKWWYKDLNDLNPNEKDMIFSNAKYTKEHNGKLYVKIYHYKNEKTIRLIVKSI